MEKAQVTQQPQSASVLEAGTYEIIRNRLHQQASALESRLEQLNTARKTVFGKRESQLLANERIRTANFCIARDMFALGQYCLFGYNVHIGLRAGIQLSDVFSVYRLENKAFKEQDMQLLADEKFQTDFQNLYRYYKDAFFTRFLRQGSYLYMIFQVSRTIGDIKAFKWLIREEILSYVDARSEHEIRQVKQFEFRWNRIDRDHQRKGRHPHVSVLDRVFVETIGGDLTIKVEDNTDDGLGIYREEVVHPDQTLDDGEYFYADIGNLLLLKIKPYQENFRYFIFNEKMQEVQRIDALADSGVLLPEGQGLIFSNGYYLRTGEYKLFESVGHGWEFESRMAAPNGEDFLYSFYHKALGQYRLLSYNLISQTVETPIQCHGFALFAGGEIGYFRAEEEAGKYHLIQIWQTAFSAAPVLPQQHVESYLVKIGNKEIVRAMAECREILNLCYKNDRYSGLYADLAGRCTEVMDTYYWIGHPEAFQMAEILEDLRQVARAAIDEYEKKISIQRGTQNEIDRVKSLAIDLFRRCRNESFDSIELYVHTLAELRSLKGAIVSLKDLRYTDTGLINQLMEQAETRQRELSEQCVGFLLQDAALAPYQHGIRQHQAALEQLQTALDGRQLETSIEQTSSGLQLLIEIVNNLQIADANDATRIIDQISALFATLNQVRAAIQRRRRELAGAEAESAFQAQLKLLDQSTVNFLDLAKTSRQCDDYLTRLLIQVEELEGQFAEYETFLPLLHEKREEIYGAFDSRRKAIAEVRQQRATQLQQAAERILKGMTSRLQSFKEAAAINGFFASDLMVEKVRNIITQLQAAEESNKAASLQTQLKVLQEEAIRQLRDRQDLYLDGENIIKLGKHHFEVNVQPLDLHIVERNGDLYYHLTGTNFYELIDDTALDALREVWSQTIISEDDSLYRAEYLAYQVFEQWLQLEPGDQTDLPALISTTVSRAYDEGYTKGIHDQDAMVILEQLTAIYRQADLLRFAPSVRAFAYLIWHQFLPENKRQEFQRQLQAAGTLLQVYPNSSDFAYLKAELTHWIKKLLQEEPAN